MMTQDQKTKAKCDFIRKEAVAIGWSEEQVAEELRLKFGKFNPEHINKYRAYIRTVVFERENIPHKETLPEPQTCPYHPEVMVIGTGKRGKYSHIPEWTCPVGGDTCFNRWKAEQSLGKPIDWSILENYGTLTRERIEAQS